MPCQGGTRARVSGVARTDISTTAQHHGQAPSYLIWVVGNNAEVGHRQSGGGVLYDAACEVIPSTGREVAAGQGAVVEPRLVVIDISHQDCHQGAGLGPLAVDIWVLLTCLGRRREQVGGAQGEEEDGVPLAVSYPP